MAPRISAVLMLLFAGVQSAGAQTPSDLLFHGSADSLLTGKTYRFSAFISSRPEPRVYSRIKDINSLKHCVSVVYGANADREFFRRSDGRKIEFDAVVAEYQDGILIGANEALGDVSLSSFENQCGRREVLVIVGP